MVKNASPPHMVNGVALTADGRWALVAYDHKVKVWDLATSTERLCLASHTSRVTGVAVSADGRWALVPYDHKVKMRIK